MASLMLALLPGSPPSAAPIGPVVSEVRVGTTDGQLAVEISISAPLRYVVAEERGDLFTLTVRLPTAVLAFPAATRDVHAGPLRQVVASTIGEGENREARLDLVFDHPLPYRTVEDRRRLVVLAGAPGVTTRVVLKGRLSETGEPVAAAEISVTQPEPTSRKGFPPPLAGLPAPHPGGSRATSASAPPPARSDIPVTPRPPIAVEGSATPPVKADAPPPPPVLAQTGGGPAPPAAARPGRGTRVLRLSLVATSPETQVRIHADGPLPEPGMLILSGPPRLVLNFEGAVFALMETTLPVGSALVQRVRVSRFRPPPDETVRVVFDLTGEAPSWVEPRPDGALVHVGSHRPSP